MREYPASNVGRKKDWDLTPGAFRRLLAWFDEGEESGGQKYIEMRQRLVTYFDRKHGAEPDDMADEVLNRVARRLEEEGSIESEAPAKYCYTVARYVFMEHLREARKAGAFLEEARRQPPCRNPTGAEAADEKEMKEKMLDCLERCAGKLEPSSRELIVRYYAGQERARIENRRALAEEFGFTMNALSIRACRVRDKLEECVRRCVGTE